MSDIGIVIVNWNTCDLLRRCLETVYESTGVSYDVVVVDNGSSDGSVEMVAKEYPQAVLMSGHGNVGYPKGNNIGLRYLGYTDDGQKMSGDAPRYALLLNPDTELPPTALADMMAYMDADESIGVAGPKIILMDGSLDLACRRAMPTPEVALWHVIRFSKLFPKSPRFARYNMTYLDENDTTEVGSVVGAFMMVRREAIGKVGLLDERFFMYGEDLDWAKRVHEAGYSVMYYPEVTIKHVKRAASSKSKRARFEFVRALLLFYDKHYRETTPLITHLAVSFGLALWGGPKLWPEIFGQASG